MLYTSIPCDTRNILHLFAEAVKPKIGGILDLAIPSSRLRLRFLVLPRGYLIMQPRQVQKP